MTLFVFPTPTIGTANIAHLSGGLFIEHIDTSNLMRVSLQLNRKISISDLQRDRRNTEMMNEEIKNLRSLGRKNPMQKQFTEETLHKIETLQFITSRVKNGLLG